MSPSKDVMDAAMAVFAECCKHFEDATTPLSPRERYYVEAYAAAMHAFACDAVRRAIVRHSNLTVPELIDQAVRNALEGK